MLAVIKLGAVVMPTTTAVGPGDLVDRMDARLRAGRHHQRPRGAQVRRRAGRLRADRRGRVGDAVGSRPTRRAGPTTPHTAASRCGPPSTRARRPTTACSSTSRRERRAGPSSSSTPRRPTPRATCRRCTGSGCSRATCTSTSAAPGWAKHAWSSFFAPWAAEATIFVYNYVRFDPAALLRVLRDARGHLALRAADGVAHAHQLRPLRRRGRRCARSSAPASRSTRRSSRRSSGPGAYDPRRLRPDRDDGCRRQHPGLAGQARLDGPPAARVPVVIVDPITNALVPRRTRPDPARARSASTSRSTRCRS